MATVSPRIVGPFSLERATTQDLQLEVYVDGKLTAPTSGSLLLRNASDNTVASGPIHIVDSKATFTVSSSLIPASAQLEDMWQAEWDINVAGSSHIFRLDGALVRRRAYPTLTTQDLFRRHGELRKLQPVSGNSWQGYIDDAWEEIYSVLVSDNRWPHKIVTPWSLRRWHMALTLYRIYTDLDSQTAGVPGRFSDLAVSYRTELERAHEDLTFRYDHTDEGDPSSGDDEVSGMPVVYLF